MCGIFANDLFSQIVISGAEEMFLGPWDGLPLQYTRPTKIELNSSSNHNLDVSCELPLSHYIHTVFKIKILSLPPEMQSAKLIFKPLKFK